jgi:hypothetical protein
VVSVSSMKKLISTPPSKNFQFCPLTFIFRSCILPIGYITKW